MYRKGLILGLVQFVTVFFCAHTQCLGKSYINTSSFNILSSSSQPIDIECILNDNLTDGNAIDTVLRTSDNSDLNHNANLSPIYVDSDATYESARLQDSNHGVENFELDDES